MVILMILSEEKKLKWSLRFIKRCHYWQYGRTKRIRKKNYNAAKRMHERALKNGGYPIPENWFLKRE